MRIQYPSSTHPFTPKVFIKLDIDNVPLEMGFMEVVEEDPKLRAMIGEVIREQQVVDGKWPHALCAVSVLIIDVQLASAGLGRPRLPLQQSSKFNLSSCCLHGNADTADLAFILFHAQMTFEMVRKGQGPADSMRVHVISWCMPPAQGV